MWIGRIDEQFKGILAPPADPRGTPANPPADPRGPPFSPPPDPLVVLAGLWIDKGLGEF